MRDHRALEQVNVLYPREEEYQRIQAARKDGYWPYISKKEEPPADFTYGEFPLPFFAELVDFAVVNYAKRDCEGDPGSGLNPLRSSRCERMEFLDLGSGAGRLVLAAASMDTRWKRVRGVEFLTSLHELAQEKLELARSEPGLLASHVRPRSPFPFSFAFATAPLCILLIPWHVTPFVLTGCDSHLLWEHQIMHTASSPAS